MIRPRLGVNIDHVATIRNARGENYPDPLRAALIAQKSGADSITIHLREDRRHIKDYDLKKMNYQWNLRKYNPLNLVAEICLDDQKKTWCKYRSCCDH